MRHVLQLLVAAAAATGFVVGGGMLLTSRDDAPGRAADAAPPAATSTPLSDFDTTGVAVHRSDFCPLLPATSVAAVLGGTPASSATYVNGQRAAITRRVTDVAHEFDCSFAAGAGSKQVTAQAWVFAPPVTPGLAARLARTQLRSRSCKPLSDAPTFGSPTAATSCRTDRGLQVSYRGLFGDAWLACSVTGRDDRDVLRERADRWCVTVAQAASTPPR